MITAHTNNNPPGTWTDQPMQSINVWQLCPKCNGNGSILTTWEGHGPFSTSCECDVCNGKKIISTFTGLPPL